MRSLRTIPTLLFLFLFGLPALHAGPVRSVRVVLPGQPSPVVGQIATVFTRQLAQRCDAAVKTHGDAAARVELVVQSGIGAEGFRIVFGADGSIRILGNDPLGLLYGVGKLLRCSRYDQGGWTPGEWRGTSVSICPIRGIYLATHFNNFYEVAPIEEVDRYVEGQGLWGLNCVIVTFPHWQFQGFDDPKAQLSIQRLKNIMRAAKRPGIRVGLVEAANDGFKSSPQELLRVPVPDAWQKAISAFETADKAAPPPKGAILFIGSSTIVRWKTLAQDFPEHRVINRGFGGSEIADSVFYADRIVIPYRPRLIVLRAGGNDIAAGKAPEQVATDFKAFVAKVRAGLPDVRIAYMTINATPSRWANVEREKKANQLIKRYIDSEKNLDYIDTWAATLGADGKPREDLFVKDRLHFNDQGYKILASIVRSHLK